MKLSLQELSELTFKRSENVALSDLSLDIKMTNVAWAMDGTRDLATVARQDNYDLQMLAENVQQLIGMGVLQVVPGSRRSTPVASNATVTVNNGLFNDLIRRLSNAIGPVAEIIIEETVAEMGYDFASFPGGKFGMLVNRLAQEIQDPKALELFKTLVDENLS
jgi:hypothetical protein